MKFIELIHFKRVKDLKIQKKKFVLLVLDWCSNNLGVGKNKCQVKIHYFKDKMFRGIFSPWNNRIEIYVYDDIFLNDLVDIVIQEYVHSLQAEQKSAVVEYEKCQNKYGVEKNPFEIEVCSVASNNKRECLKWVIKCM